MPIAFTTLGTPLASTTNATSYATASQSPTASRLLLAAVLLSRGSSTDPVTPTLSGNGLTWALVNDGVTSGNQPFPPTGTLRYRLCLFQALTGGSPSAGALTVDCGGITHTGCAVIVGESNGEVDLADPVVQVDTILHAFGAGPAAASMAAFADANNAAFSCWALDITAAIDHEGTELGDVTYSTPAARLQAQYLATQDTTPGVNWTGSANAAGIAVEVRIAAVGGDVTVMPGPISAIAVTGVPAVLVTTATTPSIALGSTPSPSPAVSTAAATILALASTPAPAVHVVVLIGPSIAVASMPDPTVIVGAAVIVPVSAITATASTPQPVVLLIAVSTASSATATTPQPALRAVVLAAASTALASTPVPTVVIGGVILNVAGEATVTDVVVYVAETGTAFVVSAVAVDALLQTATASTGDLYSATVT